jgi:uncharacterized protein YvpB
MGPVFQTFKGLLQRPGKFAWAAGGVILVLAFVAAGGARTQRAVAVAVPNQAAVLVKGPVTVNLTQEVARGFVTDIRPQTPGSWQVRQTLLGADGVTFVPQQRLIAGTTYHVRLSGLHRIGTGAAIPDMDVSFTAEKPATVTSTSPKAGVHDVPTHPQLSVTLSQPNHDVRELTGTLVPAVALKRSSKDDRVFSWEPAVPLKQGQAYTFTVTDAHMPANEKPLTQIVFTTVGPPAIASARAGDHLAPGQTIDVVFDQPMKPTTAFFDFSIPGQGTWANDRTWRFTPTGLQPGKAYSYKVKAGIPSAVGGLMEGDRSFDIATNGAVTASFSPTGQVAPNTPLRVAFDQPVDHGSAEKLFSTSPSVKGAFAWSGNTMVFTPTGMDYQTGYTYAVAKGVVPNWGLPSDHVLSASLSTAPQLIQLSVPAYKGQYWMACELSSLRMLLAFRGIAADDWGILMHLNYNPRPRDTASNTWDNPNVMYVGDVAGRPNTTGYGVHAGPLAQAGREFGRNTQAYFGVGAAWISSMIHSGNPVAFYSYSDAAPRADGWNSPQGWVNTMYPQHARVIYGVVGSASNPLGFWIHEPMNGSSFYWSAAEVMNHMNAVPGVSNQAVVVF